MTRRVTRARWAEVRRVVAASNAVSAATFYVDAVKAFQMTGQDVPWLLNHWATNKPEHPFLIWEPRDGNDRTWTYAEFLAEATSIAAGLADRVMLLHQGALARAGTPDEVLQPDVLGDVYGVPMQRLEVAGSHFTGRIIGSHPFGLGKVEHLGEMARRRSYDLDRSFAYADHYADRHLLASVGSPVAANPDRRLRRLAESRGWMIEDFVRGGTGRIAEMSKLGQIEGANL